MSDPERRFWGAHWEGGRADRRVARGEGRSRRETFRRSTMTALPGMTLYIGGGRESVLG